ncbi:hypothetical protein ACFPJ4_12800 [Lysinimonas soli]|uniref:DUF1700 domain-containing protein n=1 Tax=Lysinimonas soli TaxID=1074233 RepID=A0ABW0NRP8_9MICO
MTNHNAQSRVDRWCAVYTRGLPEEVASERREELAADVLDHTEWSAFQGNRPRAIARAITWRTIKGIPSDLAWRRAQLRAVDSAGYRMRPFDGWLLLGATALGIGLVALALTAVIRDGNGILIGDASAMPTLVAALGIMCGLLLLLREQTRPLGSLWIAAGAPVVVTVGVGLLAKNTTLLFYVSQSTPLWGVGQASIATCVAVFYIAATAWWTPERRKSSSR